MIKAAIFDLDGTILDSMQIWNELDINFLSSQGLSPKPGLQEAVMALTLRQSASYFREEYGVRLTENEILERLHDDIRVAYEERIQLKSGAKAALELLSSAGIPMAVATATELHLAEAALSRLGVAHHFTGIFTCEMVGKGKREPDVFLAALNHLGARAEQTLVFEDAVFAAQTAHEAGFKVALVHDEASLSASECGFADVYLHDFAQLAQYIEGLA